MGTQCRTYYSVQEEIQQLTRATIEPESIQEVSDLQPQSEIGGRKRKVCVAFSAFSGHENCYKLIGKALEALGFKFFHASPTSPDSYSWSEVHAKLDGYLRQNCKRHLGLGSIKGQVLAANKALEEMLQKEGGHRSQYQLILLGHCEGGDAAVEFYKEFCEIYNIQGVITITAPLQGLPCTKTVGSPQMLQEALAYDEEKGPYSCCLAWALCCCLMPCLKLCSPCCCKAFADLTPNSSLLVQHQQIYQKMQEDKLPFLAIVAQCPAPEFFQSSLFGKQGTKHLLGGGANVPSDNLIPTQSQVPPSVWQQLEIKEVKAEHGIFNIPEHPRVFRHPEAIKAIEEFCTKLFTPSEKIKQY